MRMAGAARRGTSGRSPLRWPCGRWCLQSDPALLLPAFEVARGGSACSTSRSAPRVEHLRREREVVLRRVRATADLLGDPDMPEQELRARLALLEAQRRHVDQRLEGAQARLLAHDVRAVQGEAVRQFCAELGPRLAVLGATPEGRREVFGWCLDRVIWRGGTAEIQVRLPAETVPSTDVNGRRRLPAPPQPIRPPSLLPSW